MKQVLFLIMMIMPLALWAQAVLEDEVMEENIQSVQIYWQGATISAQMNAPIAPLGSAGLVLEFDDLAFEPDRYRCTLIHCNADWTSSSLKSADYLRQFNEFNIINYDYSINTRIPYVHYSFDIPPVAKSGNYIIKVYREGAKDEVILTRRFMVYEEQLGVAVDLLPPNQSQSRRSGQQIDIMVNYGGRELKNPLETVTLVVRQNQRWDNAKVSTKPSFIREGQGQLEYQFFDGSNIFDAGNEFRFVDLRYVRTTGRNIAEIRMEDDVVYATAAINEIRAEETYLEYLDLNGQYIVQNQERGNPHLESEYVLVTFNTKWPKEAALKPYLFGKMTNWGRSPMAKMEWSEGLGLYQSTLLLKQGWYDYQVAFQTEQGWDTMSFEGSHFQTENEYDILVYYREFGSRYDELIGYSRVNANNRRF